MQASKQHKIQRGRLRFMDGSLLFYHYESLQEMLLFHYIFHTMF